MSEIPFSKPDTDEIRWNTGPAAETKTEPTSGKKNTGYAFEDIPPYDEWNWLLNKIYDLARWTQRIAIREFTTLSEALTGTDQAEETEVIRIRRADDGGTFVARNQRFQTPIINGVTGSGTGTVLAMATDGLNLYYAQGANVYGANLETGALIWSYTTGTGNVSALCVDGKGKVYVGRNVTTNNLHRLANDDGTVEETISTGAVVSDIAANEYWIAVGSSTANNCGVYLCDNLIGGVTANYSRTAAVNAVAVDDYFCYFGGTRAGGFDVEKGQLNTSVINAQVAFPTTVAPTINGIAVDGDDVYVSVLTALSLTTPWQRASTAGVFHLHRGDLYVRAYTGTTNGDQIRVDDHYIYREGTNGIEIYNKNGLGLIHVLPSAYSLGDIDPVGLCCWDGTDLYRFSLDNNSRILVRADRDIHKRPYHKLVVPVGRML